METQWKAYLTDFEQSVMVGMFESQEYHGIVEPVSLRSGKLATTPFGLFIEPLFDYRRQLVLNFYGFSKWSSGLLHTRSRPVVLSHVIHFSSVKIEYVEKYNPALLRDFVKFKRYLVGLRW